MASENIVVLTEENFAEVLSANFKSEVISMPCTENYQFKGIPYRFMFSDIYNALTNYSEGDKVTLKLYRMETKEYIETEIVLQSDKG